MPRNSTKNVTEAPSVRGARRKPRVPNRFKKSELTRAVKGVEDAGRFAERVEIDPVTGKINVYLRGDANASPPENLMDKL